jgi:hypothetical protein
MGSKSMDLIRATWRRRNLQVLADFCLHQKTDPDVMIAAAAASREVKNEFLRALKNWIKANIKDEGNRHEAENAVRSFFIVNGLRVITKPYSDVYHRPTSRDASTGRSGSS